MKSRLVLITGTSRGLGRAMAEGFAARGDRVAGCSRSGAVPDGLVEGGHSFAAVDVSDFAAVQDWAGTVLEEHGPPDLLLNSAAVINRSALLRDLEAEEFSQLVDVNVKGVFHVLRAFLPAMEKKGSGVVVNFSSGWGRSTSPEVASYCASKWAVEGLTRALVQELPRGLAAVAFNPGIIDTEMLRSCFGEGAGHYPDAAEWGKVAVPFLAGLTAADNGGILTCPGH